jgi:hypothetical protein
MSDTISSLSITVDTLASPQILSPREGTILLFSEQGHKFILQIFCLLRTIMNRASSAERSTANRTSRGEPEPDPEPPAAPP